MSDKKAPVGYIKATEALKLMGVVEMDAHPSVSDYTRKLPDSLVRINGVWVVPFEDFKEFASRRADVLKRGIPSIQVQHKFLGIQNTTYAKLRRLYGDIPSRYFGSTKLVLPEDALAWLDKAAESDIEDTRLASVDEARRQLEEARDRIRSIADRKIEARRKVWEERRLRLTEALESHKASESSE